MKDRNLWISVISLLLAAALIAVGANLPGITGAVADKATIGSISYDAFQSVQLELREGNTLSTVEKFFLVRNSESIVVSENDTVMTEAQAKAAAEAALEPYFDAGLLPGWEGEYAITCRPVLAYDTATALYGYFWGVYLTLEEDAPYSQLNLVIDDETGKLVNLYFWMREPVFEAEELDDRLETFVHTFLGGLELDLPEEGRDTTTSKEGRSTQYFWSFENLNGQTSFGAEFCIFPQGFYSN